MTAWYPAFALAAIVLGSIPFGLIVGRVFFHSDIRSSGSGNIGAANALRTYGRGGGAAVLLLDALKGFVPAFVVLHLSANAGPGPAALCACAAVAGHCYSPWLRFNGGKGVATWLGAVAALAWPVALGFVAIWLALVVPTRFAALGSLAATAASAVGLWYATRDPAVGVWSLAAAAIIFWKHRENIARLAAGRENKIGFGRASRA